MTHQLESANTQPDARFHSQGNTRSLLQAACAVTLLIMPMRNSKGCCIIKIDQPLIIRSHHHHHHHHYHHHHHHHIATLFFTSPIKLPATAASPQLKRSALSSFASLPSPPQRPVCAAGDNPPPSTCLYIYIYIYLSRQSAFVREAKTQGTSARLQNECLGCI